MKPLDYIIFFQTLTTYSTINIHMPSGRLANICSIELKSTAFRLARADTGQAMRHKGEPGLAWATGSPPEAPGWR